MSPSERIQPLPVELCSFFIDRVIAIYNDKNHMNMNFPFFGAGFANYYEWADVTIRFLDTPSTEAKAKILKNVPKPLSPATPENDGADATAHNEEMFIGRFLHVGSEQFVNMYIEEAYGQGAAQDEGSDDEEDFAELGSEFYVSETASLAFEADIERWLNEVHQISPIELVVRSEDAEAGGTELSEWHTESLDLLPALIKKWDSDPYTYQQSADEKALFSSVCGALFNYAGLDPALVPKRFIETFFQDMQQ